MCALPISPGRLAPGLAVSGSRGAEGSLGRPGPLRLPNIESHPFPVAPPGLAARGRTRSLSRNPYDKVGATTVKGRGEIGRASGRDRVCQYVEFSVVVG